MNCKNCILLLLFFLSGFSCIDEALFNSGATLTRTTPVPAFSTIEAESTFDIEIVRDTVTKIVVTCGEHLHPFINISVKDDILYLSHDITNNWSRKYQRVKLEIHTGPFSRINVRHPVRIFNNDVYKGEAFAIVDFGKYCELDMTVDVDYCVVAMSSDNFGQFKVRGKAVHAQIWGWGSCSVKADSLLTDNCSVLHRGIGNVYVNTSGQLDVSLESSGNVYYSGNPSKINIIQRLGTGDVFKK